MPRKTKFSSAWMEKTDRNGCKLSEWCVECPKDVHSAFCKICEKKCSISNMGLSQLLSHADSNKHKQRLNSQKNQIKLIQEKSGENMCQIRLSERDPSYRHWIPKTEKDKILKAEAIIILTAIKSNFSFRSIGELSVMCASAFEDSTIAAKIQLSENQARYVTKFGLAPYIRKQTFLDLTSSSSQSENLLPLVDVGTCVLHQMHTALRKGLDQMECDVDSFALNIFQWFKLSAARREDFHNIQLQELADSTADHVFLRHIDSRWLTLGPICERLLEQYDVLKEYFLVVLPKKNIKSSDKYKQIRDFLKNPKSLIYINIVSFLCNTFMPFLTLFQSESPLIHILFSKLNELLKSIMFMFIKDEAISEKEGLSLTNVNCRDSGIWLPLKKLDVGVGAKKILVYSDHKEVLSNMRNVYIVICEYMQKKLPLSNPLLNDLQYINPMYQKNPKAKDAISRLAVHMLKVTKTDAVCDKIKSEFQTYICEDISKEIESFSSSKDICKFWAQISKVKDCSGDVKFKNLTRLVKSCLTISHGNSIPERGFSLNNVIVTKERMNLSEIAIHSLRLCKDFVRIDPNIPSLITKDLITYIEKSYAEYAAYLEQLKKDKERLALKRKIDAEEDDLKLAKKRERETLQERLNELGAEESELMDQQKAAHTLSNEASEKLHIGIKNNDFQNIKIAQMMLDTSNTTIKNVDAKLSLIQQQKAKINKKMK